MYIPYDSRLNYHPEYDGYSINGELFVLKVIIHFFFYFYN